jgi:diacylglycerol kinase (ATP)
MEIHKLTPRARVRSFLCALRGLAVVFSSQPNSWIMLLAAVCTVVMGALLQVSLWEWCLLLIVMSVVIIAEVMNTAIEFLTDLISPERHSLAGKAKDAAAGAVLLAACLAFLVGIIVLGPRLLIALGVW